jgi:glycosyltransferase involved in cell wall biosynthesis
MGERRHICMLLDHAFPPDLRVENEARTLADAGYHVTIVAIDPDDRGHEQLSEHITVYRARVSRQIRNKARGLAASLPLFDWILRRVLYDLHKTRSIDAFHAHDLYLFGAALRAGRRFDVPVVGDMHENWVHALKHYKWSTTPPGKWVVNLKKWERLEVGWAREVDRLIVVIDEMAERITEQLTSDGSDIAHVVTVPNTIQRHVFEGWSTSKPEDMPAGRPVLLYTGGMDLHRGLEDPVRAMPAVCEAHPDAQLVLVGDGAVRAELEALSASLGLSSSVHFLGWKEQETVRGYMEAATIGLIPHRKTMHTDHTIPHKLFHYMHAGLPCVVSNCKPLERIVTAESCGLVYPSGDSDALASILIKLASDQDEMRRMANVGRSAVQERWNWEATSKALVSLYHGLFAS